MTLYIGTSKPHYEGEEVTDRVFFTDINLAKERAQMLAEQDGAMFGMVYEISSKIDEVTSRREPNTVIRQVEWSI
jgi:hypothetical protein